MDERERRRQRRYREAMRNRIIAAAFLAVLIVGIIFIVKGCRDKKQAQEEQPQEEQPARDPKQARGPVPDKAFVGLEIRGKGWKIVFDGSYDRTRVIFKRKPSNAAREALDKHGFFWSPAMQSWNKKLTHKAFRAAQALALELRTICDRIAIVAEGKVVDVLETNASDADFGLAMSGIKPEHVKQKGGEAHV